MMAAIYAQVLHECYYNVNIYHLYSVKLHTIHMQVLGCKETLQLKGLALVTFALLTFALVTFALVTFASLTYAYINKSHCYVTATSQLQPVVAPCGPCLRSL